VPGHLLALPSSALAVHPARPVLPSPNAQEVDGVAGAKARSTWAAACKEPVFLWLAGSHPLCSCGPLFPQCSIPMFYPNVLSQCSIPLFPQCSIPMFCPNVLSQCSIPMFSPPVLPWPMVPSPPCGHREPNKAHGASPLEHRTMQKKHVRMHPLPTRAAPRCAARWAGVIEGHPARTPERGLQPRRRPACCRRRDGSSSRG